MEGKNETPPEPSSEKSGRISRRALILGAIGTGIGLLVGKGQPSPNPAQKEAIPNPSPRASTETLPSPGPSPIPNPSPAPTSEARFSYTGDSLAKTNYIVSGNFIYLAMIFLLVLAVLKLRLQINWQSIHPNRAYL